MLNNKTNIVLILWATLSMQAPQPVNAAISKAALATILGAAMVTGGGIAGGFAAKQKKKARTAKITKQQQKAATKKLRVLRDCLLGLGIPLTVIGLVILGARHNTMRMYNNSKKRWRSKQTEKVSPPEKKRALKPFSATLGSSNGSSITLQFDAQKNLDEESIAALKAAATAAGALMPDTLKPGGFDFICHLEEKEEDNHWYCGMPTGSKKLYILFPHGSNPFTWNENMPISRTSSHCLRSLILQKMPEK